MKHFVWIVVGFFMLASGPAFSQVAPSEAEVSAYTGLHKAAHVGDDKAVRDLIKNGAPLEAKDDAGRTPLHVAAFASQYDIVRLLAEAGANMNALENSAYDIVTIAAVANDVKMVDLALTLGTSAGNITSPYDGTALIAAAHLGHSQVVKLLVDAEAPLDHINNLGWTALIEAVVLGDGGPNHVETARILVEAGADRSIGDRQGVTPIEHARGRGYKQMTTTIGSN